MARYRRAPKKQAPAGQAPSVEVAVAVAVEAEGEGGAAAGGAADSRDARREPPQPLVLENAHFEAYYRKQAICPPEEWDRFLAACRSELPMSFRINCSAFTAEHLLVQLQGLAATAEAAATETAAAPTSAPAVARGDGDDVEAVPTELRWYPRHLAWQLTGVCSWALHRNARHKELKQWLRWLQECGAITRQEAVSMIPPLCLDVQPDHLVLDLCAAPGSKASQILEMLHWRGGQAPPGAIVANEIVSKRAEVLSHQMGRMGSSAYVVTNFDAQFFPALFDEAGQPLLFDRVLADVPCSGDGTMRKYPAVWSTWTPRDALGLHHRQYTILCRGVELLKVGGRLVYSTCSLNPIENEAVVAAVVRRYGASVSLLPFPELEGLRGSPGLPSWVVPHPDVEQEVCWERPEQVPPELRDKILGGCFPAAPGSPEDEVWKQACGYCRRFMPHEADTGGFFVAVLTKNFAPDVLHKVASTRSAGGKPTARVSQEGGEAMRDNDDVDEEGVGGAEAPRDGAADVKGLPAQQGAADVADCGADGPSQKPARQKKKKPLRAFSDFESVPLDGPDWRAAAQFLGIELGGPFRICRRGGRDRRMFCVSEGAARVLLSQARMSVRVMTAGVRILERLHEGRDDGAPSAWRACQEGAPLLLQLGLRRRLDANSAFLRQILSRGEVDRASLLAAADRGDLSGLGNLAVESATAQDGTGARAEEDPGAQLLSGSVVVTLRRGEAIAEPSAGEPVLAFAGLLTPRGLELYTPKGELKAALESLALVEQKTVPWLQRKQ